jgi:hypothetical protein
VHDRVKRTGFREGVVPGQGDLRNGEVGMFMEPNDMVLCTSSANLSLPVICYSYKYFL